MIYFVQNIVILLLLFNVPQFVFKTSTEMEEKAQDGNGLLQCNICCQELMYCVRLGIGFCVLMSWRLLCSTVPCASSHKREDTSKNQASRTLASARAKKDRKTGTIIKPMPGTGGHACVKTESKACGR